ncbi:MAG: hypothetical protein GXN95_00905 [Methanococci archaeon]|nr:hypothetical protein [Methanococci archaeon]
MITDENDLKIIEEMKIKLLDNSSDILSFLILLNSGEKSIEKNEITKKLLNVVEANTEACKLLIKYETEGEIYREWLKEIEEEKKKLAEKG